MAASAIAVLAIVFMTASASAADWPFYGKDYANSRDGGTDGPSAATAAGLKRAWSFQSSDGDFTGTPVIGSGTVVAGSGGGTVFALDAATGTLRWSHDFNEPINGSAAISDGLVYMALATPGSPKLVALDLATGAVRWSTVVDSQKDADVYGSPVVWNKTVYLGTSAFSGEVKDPSVNARGSVVALDGTAGTIKWKTYTVPPGYDGGGVWSTAAIDTAVGYLYLGTGQAYHSPAANTTDSILKIDPRNGHLVDHFQATAGDVWNQTNGIASGTNADFGSSPNLIAGPGGRLLVGDGQKSGTYWAVDRGTLDPMWNTTVGAQSQVGGILGSTAYDGARIYGPDSVGGEVWALTPDGARAWVTSSGAPANFAPVAVANGVVWNNDTNGFLNAHDAATGLAIAKYPLGAPSWGGVAISGGTVYAVTGAQTSSGYVEAFRP